MTVIYILIAVIVGWFIGFLDSNMRTAKKIQAADTKAQVAIEEAKRKTAQIEKTPLAGSSFEDDPGRVTLPELQSWSRWVLIHLQLHLVMLHPT